MYNIRKLDCSNNNLDNLDVSVSITLNELIVNKEVNVTGVLGSCIIYVCKICKLIVRC